MWNLPHLCERVVFIQHHGHSSAPIDDAIVTVQEHVRESLRVSKTFGDLLDRRGVIKAVEYHLLEILQVKQFVGYHFHLLCAIPVQLPIPGGGGIASNAPRGTVLHKAAVVTIVLVMVLLV